jgi:hypothetical protein
LAAVDGPLVVGGKAFTSRRYASGRLATVICIVHDAMIGKLSRPVRERFPPRGFA